MKKALLTMALFSASITFTNAQNWVKTSAPDTINYMGIRTFGNDTIYAWGISEGYQPNTLVTSFDGGKTWIVGTYKGRFLEPVASPAGLHVYHSSIPSRIEYTTDGGITWQTTEGSDGYKPMGLLPNGKLLLGKYNAGQLNISPDYVSLGTDYGTLFEYKADFWTSAINPSTGRIIFGRSNGEVQLGFSDDNGQSFTQISLEELIGSIHSPLISYAKDNTFFNASMTGVRVSTDNGNTWTNCSPIGGILHDMIATHSGRVVACMTDRKVFSSTDNGQSWSLFMNGLPDTLEMQGLAKTDNGNIWLAEGKIKSGGIWYTNEDVEEEEDPTNVGTLQAQSIINIYPNPAYKTLNIELKENTQIRIINILGVLVFGENLNTGKHNIDVSKLTKGIYLLQTDKGQAVKFVKE